MVCRGPVVRVPHTSESSVRLSPSTRFSPFLWSKPRNFPRYDDSSQPSRGLTLKRTRFLLALAAPCSPDHSISRRVAGLRIEATLWTPFERFRRFGLERRTLSTYKQALSSDLRRPLKLIDDLLITCCAVCYTCASLSHASIY